jgi:hypothetical protein
MLKAVKASVHRMTSHLQLTSGYLEMENSTKALGKTRETIKERHALLVLPRRHEAVPMTPHRSPLLPRGPSGALPHRRYLRAGRRHAAGSAYSPTKQLDTTAYIHFCRCAFGYGTTRVRRVS